MADGVHFCERPFRHHDLIRMIVERDPSQAPVVGEQGFMTHDLRFIGRVGAKQMAYAAKQIKSLKGSDHLFSEDLW